MGTWVQPPPYGHIGNVSWDLVNNRFDLSQQYAENSYGMTVDFVNDLQSWLGSIDNELPNLSPINVGSVNVPAMNFDSRPIFGNLNLPTDWPANLPTTAVLEPIPELDDIEMPAMTVQPPAWNTPDKPNIEDHSSPGAPPDISIVPIPSVPVLVMPDSPQLGDVIIPSAPLIALPEFEGILPNEILRTPAEFSWQESPYNSPIWNDLLNVTLDGLRYGGTGLHPDVYEDIWSRATARQHFEAEKRYREIEDDYAAKSFPAPPGSEASALREVSADVDRNLTELNGQLMKEEADLAQANTHFTIEKAIEMEGILRDFHNSRDDRLLDAAKALAGSAIDIFNALVSKYNANLDRYKAEASVYESRVKASLTQIEIFKAQVEAARVSSDVQKNLVLIYSEQIKALETRVKMYTAQVEAAKVTSEIESIKLDIFKAQIEAYIAEMSAEKVKVELYTAELTGEKIKAETYAEQVRAFTSQVEAKKAQADLSIKILSTSLDRNRLLIDQYKGELSGYVANVEATARKTDAVVSGFTAEVAGYSAETQALGMEYEVKIKEIDANIESAKLDLAKGVAEIDAATKGFLAVKELQLKGSEATIDVGAQLAASAWSAVNASATLGTSTTAQETHRYGHNEAITERHSYSHE